LSTDEIYNFIQVDDHVATAGQPTAEQLAAVRDDGYQVVVNLAPVDERSEAVDEANTVRSLGMTYHHLPVPWDDPRPEHFREFVEIMDGIGTGKVFVHCAANYRVTAFYSLYASQRRGWSDTQADELMATVWGDEPTQQMDDAWRTFVETVRG
jgi:protein tyrosine phosphatase (PTP) superfamily phosphohydrolase (DUF442 family)